MPEKMNERKKKLNLSTKSSKKATEADPKKLQFSSEFVECLDKEQDGMCDFGEE